MSVDEMYARLGAIHGEDCSICSFVDPSEGDYMPDGSDDQGYDDWGE